MKDIIITFVTLLLLAGVGIITFDVTASLLEDQSTSSAAPHHHNTHLHKGEAYVHDHRINTAIPNPNHLISSDIRSIILKSRSSDFHWNILR